MNIRRSYCVVLRKDNNLHNDRSSLCSTDTSIVLVNSNVYQDGWENYDKALCHRNRNVTKGFSSLRTWREHATEGTQRTVDARTEDDREKTVSFAEGGRDYRSWAGKPRINRWRVVLPSQWRVPAVDHPFHALLFRCNPVKTRPNSRSAAAESGST